MKLLKRAVSMFLAGITALTMMCAGTINAGAVSSQMYIDAEDGIDGSHIYLRGILNEDFVAAGNRAIENNGEWFVIIPFGTEKYLECECPVYNEGTDQVYGSIPAVGSLNGKSVELVGSFANYDLYYSGSWIVYFSVSKEFYAEFIKAKKLIFVLAF